MVNQIVLCIFLALDLAISPSQSATTLAEMETNSTQAPTTLAGVLEESSIQAETTSSAPVVEESSTQAETTSSAPVVEESSTQAETTSSAPVVEVSSTQAETTSSAPVVEVSSTQAETTSSAPVVEESSTQGETISSAPVVVISSTQAETTSSAPVVEVSSTQAETTSSAPVVEESSTQAETISSAPVVEVSSTQAETTSSASDACIPNPCQNGGTCVKYESTYYCLCDYRYTGQNCEVDTLASSTEAATTTTASDPCLPDPCQNGGSCLNYGALYYCLCNNGYTGVNCEVATLESSTETTITTTVVTDLASTSGQEATTTVPGSIQELESALQQNFNNVSEAEANDFVNKTAQLLFNNVLNNTSTASSQIESVVTKLENTLENLMNALLNSTNDTSVQVTNGLLSITSVKATGSDMDSNYNNAYGSFAFPKWSTFRDRMEEDKITIHILSYVSNPYPYVVNPQEVNAGVMKIKAVDRSLDEVHLDDPDDPASLTMDSSSVLGDTSRWASMEPLNTVEGGYIFTSTCRKGSDSLVLEIDLESPTCFVYGLYGNMMPDIKKPDVKITVKNNEIMETYPKYLTALLNNRRLQMVLVNQWPDKEYKFSALVQCTDLSHRSKRSITTAGYRTSNINMRYLDTTTNTWSPSNDLQINSVHGNSIRFKSTFFGTFSASVFFIPPAPINFEDIFSNFSEKFAQTPHVFAIELSLIIIFVLLTILLRRADKKDAELWTYFPLVDNPENGIKEYFITVHTSVRSSRKFTSVPFLNIKGISGETGTRILADGVRKNFTAGTSSCFCLRTNKVLGALKVVQIWHDNSGAAPRWLLDKIVITDPQCNKRYIFNCGEWLSLDSEDGRTWRNLNTNIETDAVFPEICSQRLYNDHLWLSVYKRPSYSRFSRVQRLWTLVSLLFLAMVTSAMWYNTSDEYTGNSVSLGPFKLSYKEFYVGLMSGVIAILPSMLIIAIFKYRRCKDELKDIKDESWTSNKKHDGYLIPWWFIFFGYGLIIIVITVTGTFTFLYSLDWGPELTQDWILSFILGTSQGMFLIEPLKVVLISLIVACLCSKSITTTSEIAPLRQVQFGDTRMTNKYDAKIDFEDMKCPDQHAEDDLLKERRHRIQLDKRLHSLLVDFITKLVYLTLLCIMVSHHMVSQSYAEKKYLGDAIKSNIQTDNINGIWDWIENSFIDTVFPKRLYNGALRTAYLQRFMENGYSYRLGLARLRQVRMSGACEVPGVMKKAVHICQRVYNSEYEEKGRFCPGWKQNNLTCFDDKDKISQSFVYSSSDRELETYGLYAVYGEGGYSITIGPQRDLALSYARSLKTLTWIDTFTRALFVEVVTMNAATRLHSYVKMTFELSPFGDINIKSDIKSSNLYPYLGPWDYIILFIQLIFILITIIRIVKFVMSVYKMKIRSLVTVSIWIEFLRLVFCVTAIILYILRIDSTLSAIKKLSDNIDSFVSIEKVQMLDEGYRLCLSAEVFIATLALLKPLTFNYYLHLMRTSLVISCGQIISATLVIYLLIIAFAALLYLLVGPYNTEMRDMVSALMTMTRLSLTIAKFKNTLEEVDSIQLEIIFMIFMILMSFVIINLFVAVVSTMFGLMKSNAHNLENVEGFDAELNEHFWWKINKWFSQIADFLCIRNQNDFDNQIDNRRQKRYSEIFRGQFDAIDKHLDHECQEDVLYSKLLVGSISQILFFSPKGIPLQHRIFYEHGYSKYIFNRKGGNPELCIKLPLKSYPKDASLQCADVTAYMEKELLPFDDELSDRTVYQLEKSVPYTVQGKIQCEIYNADNDNNPCGLEILVSFNSGQTWEVCNNERSKDKNGNTTTVMSTVLNTLPTHITTKQKSDFEEFIVTPEGCEISPKSKSDVQLKFESQCFYSDCTVRIKTQPYSQSTSIFLWLNRQLVKPIEVRIPCVNDNSQELIVIKREGRSNWFIVNTYFTYNQGYAVFKLQMEHTSTWISFLVKASVMQWIGSKSIVKNSSITNVVNLTSKYQQVAVRWRQFAKRLNLTTDYINLISQRELISEEERCFLVFYKYAEIQPNIKVKDIIKVLRLEGFQQVANGLERFINANKSKPKTTPNGGYR